MDAASLDICFFVLKTFLIAELLKKMTVARLIYRYTYHLGLNVTLLIYNLTEADAMTWLKLNSSHICVPSIERAHITIQ